MLVAMRKHMKAVFWAIIIILVPAFAVFYVPRYFERTGGDVKYGEIYGRTVTLKHFQAAYQAEGRALAHVAGSLVGMEYRRPEYRFLGTLREALLAEFGMTLVPDQEWRDRPLVREQLEHAFTDPETGRFDEAAYRKRRRELGLTDEEYLFAFKNDFMLLNYYLPQLMSSDNPGALEVMRRRVWRRLALAHEAERLKIPVSDQDVVNYLHLLYPDQEGGIDQDRYGEALRAMQLSRVDFENELRTTIRIATLLRTVLDSAKADPDEVEEEFHDLYQTFKLAYHVVPYKPYADPDALREDEVLAWYMDNRTHADTLLIEPRVAVVYVLVESKGFEGEVEVEDSELREYYDSHRVEFKADFDACKPAVHDVVVKRKALEAARDEAGSLFSATRTSDRLIGAVMRANAEAQAPDGEGTAREYVLRSTPPFGKEGPIDDTIGEDEEDFRNAAFALELGEVLPRPIRVAQGWCVLAPTRIVPDPGIPEGPKGKAFWPFYMVRGAARLGAAIEQAKPFAVEQAEFQYRAVHELMEAEGLSFAEACERLELATTTTRFLSIEDDEIPGLKEGDQLIAMGARLRHTREAIEDGILKPEDAFVFSGDDEAVLFDVPEVREPSARLRSREMAWFAEGPARRAIVGEVYREWLDQVEARAQVIDLAQEDLERQRAQQQSQGQPGGLAP